MHVCMHVETNVYTYMYILIYVYTLTYICIRIIYTNICVYIDIHIMEGFVVGYSCSGRRVGLIMKTP